MSDNLGTFPPPSAPDVTVTETVKGIAGAPGVAVGTALVIGEMRAAYTRRNVHTAQIEGELFRASARRPIAPRRRCDWSPRASR